MVYFYKFNRLYNTFLVVYIFMNKYLIALIVSLFLLSGCVKTNTVNNPYEIQYRGQMLSYYDTKDQINIENFNIIDSIKKYDYNNNNIFINSQGIIRFISIKDRNVKTYKSISVGDNIEKLQKSFENFENIAVIHDSGPYIDYRILFDENNFLKDQKIQNPKDNWIYINYTTDGTYITKIMISDVKFASKLS